MANKIEWCDLCKREHPYPLKNTGPLSYVGLRLTRLKRDAKGRFITRTKDILGKNIKERPDG